MTKFRTSTSRPNLRAFFRSLQISPFRMSTVIVLFSISVVCLVSAKPKLTISQINKIRSDCGDDAVYWRNNCINNIPVNTTDRQRDVDDCNKGAESVDLDCLRRGGVTAPVGGTLPWSTPIPKQGSPNPTATPRRGPVGVSGLPKSNPTPTPGKGKGPGPVSSKPKSNPKPTPSATASPTLLAKPKPTPRHH